MRRIPLLSLILLIILGQGVFADPDGITKRFGLFIGANNGGRERQTLRYAVSDAKAMAKVFLDMGGINPEDTVLLVEPSVREINEQIDTITRQIRVAKNDYKRTELVFYYSGHSDEEGIMLNREKYGYKDLRDRINALPSDMRIIILDSCSSGAITRTKGGVKTKPFMIDSSNSAEGYAFLTSSSADEVSQESDLIEGSYFTHSLVAGLRGAADSIGDGRVSLNELYRFAYNETLAKTETSLHGAQHPNYDMQISGTGDVILTDLKETSASLILGEDVTGRVSIRDGSDYLIAEITKANQKQMELGLEPGVYRITVQQGDRFYRTEVTLTKEAKTPVVMAQFKPVTATPGVPRGDVPGETLSEDERLLEEARKNMNRNQETTAAVPEVQIQEPADYPVEAVKFQFIPDSWTGRKPSKKQNSFLFGLVAADGFILNGIGIGGIAVTNYGEVNGLQVAFVYTKADGPMTGIQTALGASVANDRVHGVQAAMVANIAGKNVDGLQAGFFNMVGKDMKGLQTGFINWVSGSNLGLQAGLVNYSGTGGFGFQMGLVNVSMNPNSVPLGLINFVKGGIFHPAVHMDDMQFVNVSLRTGSKYFYSIWMIGYKHYDPTKPGDEPWTGFDNPRANNYFTSRAGIGGELPLGRLFLNLDLLAGTVVSSDVLVNGKGSNSGEDCDLYDQATTIMAQLRFTLGFKMFEHFGLYAGISYDFFHKLSKESPVPVSASFYTFPWSDGNNIHRVGFYGGIQF